VRVAVLGAGVIGIATAYELWRDGHEVVVVDRAGEPARGTSFANAGMIAPGHAYAWSSPKALRTLARALLRDDLALRFRFQADPAFWRWCWRFYRQCTAERAAANTRRKVALCRYSQDRLHTVVRETGIAYGARTGGALYLYRDAAGLAQAAAKAQILRDEGVEVRAVTPDEAAAVDPVYGPVRERFAGALYAPGDESGDARLFTCGLAEWLGSRGIEFRLALGADAYVLALGCWSARFGRALGLDLPVYPIKGYSVTLPIEGRNTPRASTRTICSRLRTSATGSG
jgi:D-amino-acid dehydrogenase